MSDTQWMRQCQRFHADGTPCPYRTQYVDGWCREPGCPGFQRASATSAPETYGSPKGTRRHIAQTAHIPLNGLSIDDVPDVRLTTRAVDSFRFHHGGGIREAELQLRVMLEDFILESARSVVKSGYVRLARAGFTMTLSPTMNVVVGYSTVHRERTWQQVKAGVPSRIRERNRTSRWEDEFAPVPDPGAPVTLDRFPASVDPGSIALTARVRRSFVKIEGLPNEGCDERLDDRIRAEFASFPSGTVTKRDDGLFEVTVEGRTWLVSEDAQTLIGVKRAAADASRPL